MEEIKRYEFKSSTVDDAVAKGLKELGLTREEVDCEIKSYGGIFSKATVILTPKAKAEADEAEVETAEVAEQTEDAEVAMQAEPASDGGEAPLEISAAAEASEAFVAELLAKMHIKCTARASGTGDEVLVSITGEDAGAAIGYRGEVLDAIQYFALLIANKGEKEFIHVTVDAENYRKKRKDTLTNLALRLARKTARTGRKTELEPMNPFERRVIHTALQSHPDVTTVSAGEGRFRHVVIVPKHEREDVGDSAVEMRYGTSSDFRRKGSVKTRSFGAKKRRF